MIWTELVICVAALVFFAYKLCLEGMLVSERTTLEHAVIGLFFFAMATSFPELIASTGSIAFYGNIGIGYGNIMGSVMVNTMILSIASLFFAKESLNLKLAGANLKAARLVVLLAGVLFLMGIFRISLPGAFQLGRMGSESIILILTYLFYLRFIAKLKQSYGTSFSKSRLPFRSIWMKFFVLLGIVAFLSLWMARIADRLVSVTTLGQGLVGSLFLGFATSLPELIVSVSAIFAGSADMALGNIFGSNLFNLAIIPVLDTLTSRPILGLLERDTIIATFFAMLLSALALLGTSGKSKVATHRFWNGLVFIMGLAGFVLIWFFR